MFQKIALDAKKELSGFQGAGWNRNSPDRQAARALLDSKPPIARLIGFGVQKIGDRHAVGFMKFGPQHADPMDALHGGVMCDLADAARGMAFASTLAPRRIFHDD